MGLSVLMSANEPSMMRPPFWGVSAEAAGSGPPPGWPAQAVATIDATAIPAMRRDVVRANRCMPHSLLSLSVRVRV